MFCSSCGAEAAQGLRYCTRCGADLNPAEKTPSAAKPKGVGWIVAFGIAMMMGMPAGGIAMVFERIPALLEKGLPLWFLTVLAIISLLMMSVATVLLSRLLLPVFKAYLESGEASDPEKQRLAGPAPAQIDAPRAVRSSIAEQTTRSFEPLPGERNTQE